MSNADVVSYWFVDYFSTGALARDADAYAEALKAKDDLVGRLDAAKGHDSAGVIDLWFREKIANGGAIARNTNAFNEVFAAKGDLVSRLAAAAPAPDSAPPAKPAKAAKSDSAA